MATSEWEATPPEADQNHTEEVTHINNAILGQGYRVLRHIKGGVLYEKGDPGNYQRLLILKTAGSDAGTVITFNDQGCIQLMDLKGLDWPRLVSILGPLSAITRTI